MTTENNEQVVDEPDLCECEWCGAIVNEDDIHSADTDDGYVHICNDCLENTVTCDDCGCLIRNQYNAYQVERHHLVCSHCYDNYGTCEYCDGVYHYDNGPECGCEDASSSYIHDYSYRPRPNFLRTDGVSHSSKVLYLGCELEVENQGCDSISYGAERCYDSSRGEDLYYLKHDGSISNGFELVTHPMTLDYIRDDFKWTIADKLRNLDYASWEADDACGFHIHLTRSAFVSRSHVFKFVWFIYANAEPLIKFAGRHNTSYARFEATELQTLTDKACGGGQTTRYYALNTMNSKTIELRFMRGSLNRETLIAYCEFADAVFHYTKTLSIRDIADRSGITFGAFNDWAKKQNYPEMNARIARRVRELSEA